MMFGDTEGPANHGSIGFGISMRQLADEPSRHPGFALGIGECVRLDTGAIILKAAGGLGDECLIGQSCGQDFTTDGIGECDVRPHFKT